VNASSPTPSDRLLQDARAAYEAGAHDEAIRFVSHCLRNDPDERRAYDLAALILEAKDASIREGLLFRLCHDNFEEARHFYRLGFRFMGADLPHLARPILDRACRLDPVNPDIRIEFAVSLAETGDHRGALTTLGQLDPALPSHNPSVVFLDAWCRLLTGDEPGASRGLERLDAMQAAPRYDPALRERLELGLERFRAVGRPDRADLPGWHFIQYGGAILDASDLGEMRGRYGLVLETYEELGARLAALAALTERLSLPVKRVLTLESDDAVVLGEALARRWNVDSAPLPPDEVPKAGEVLVAAALGDLDRAPRLARRIPGSVLYAHKLDWTRSAPVSPDVTGLVVQAHFFPWNRAYRHDRLENRFIERPPDRRPREEIVDHLADRIPARPPQALAERLDFYVQQRALSVFAPDSPIARRPPFRQESPVAGNRFV